MVEYTRSWVGSTGWSENIVLGTFHSMKRRRPRRKFGATQKDRMFLACLPDAGAAARIYALAEELKASRKLEGTLTRPEHLHVTLFHLGDWNGLPDLIAESADAAAQAAAAGTAPFDVIFDRAQSLGNSTGVYPFVLLGDDRSTPLHRFRETLGNALTQNGLGGAVRDSEFRPHVTLTRDETRVGRVPVAPITWTVRNFVLVHSLLGRTTHIHLARWSLGALAEREK
jgi:2'-5' RNA ligase